VVSDQVATDFEDRSVRNERKKQEKAVVKAKKEAEKQAKEANRPQSGEDQV